VSHGTPLELDAVEADDWTFRDMTWDGVVCAENPCRLALEKDTVVHAVFHPPVELTVVVSRGGTVTSSPDRIDCSASTCSATFRAGESVVLTAVPHGEHSVTWTGGCVIQEPEPREPRCGLGSGSGSGSGPASGR
jgi:hypothetical protein